MRDQRHLYLIVPFLTLIATVASLWPVVSAQTQSDPPVPILGQLGQPAYGQPRSTDNRLITGVLTGMWEDDFRTGNSTISFLLNELGGERYEIILDDVSGTSHQQIWRLNGEQVTISGHMTGNNHVAGRERQLHVSAVYLNSLHRDKVNQGIVGDIPYISVLCSFPDADESFESLSYYQKMYDNEYPMVRHFWEELSYGKVSLVGSGVAGPYPMPHPRAYYNGYWQLAQDCLSLADPEVDFTAYYGINLMLDKGNDSSASGGFWRGTLDGVEKSWPMTRLPPAWGWADMYVILHEMGHSFGLTHSTTQYGGDYGSPWDVMSNPICDNRHPLYGCLGQHTIAYHKQTLGWLNPSDIYTVTEGIASGIVLNRLARPEGDGYLAINVPLFGEHGPYYTIEAREKVGHDIGLPGEGVIIHEVSPTGAPHRYVGAEVIDVDGNGNTGDSGAIWTVGESFVHPNGMTVTVRSKSQGSYVVDVELAPLPLTSCDDPRLLSNSECIALIGLYEATNGENWRRDSSWMDIAEPCFWYGVECDFNPDRDEGSALLTVHALFLSNNELSGTLPPDLRLLKHLTNLYVEDNQLTGPIPAELGELESLYALYLQNNKLTGSLPSELANLKNLGLLYLYNNELHGLLPPGLGNINTLEGVIVNDNLFYGPVPSTFKDLKLDTFLYHNTQLCDPPDRSFQSWLGTIPYVRSNGIFCTTSLYADFDIGRPGSRFNVSGVVFEPNTEAAVEINGNVLGTIRSDVNGNIGFVLSTSTADEGKYQLVVRSNSREARYSIRVTKNGPLRTNQGNGPVFEVPTGISQKDILLPVTLRPR